MFSLIFSCTYSRFTPVVFFEAEGAGAGGATVENPAVPKQPDIESIVQKAIQGVLDSNRVKGDKDEALNVLAAKAIKEEKRAQAAEAKIGTLPDDVQAKLSAYEALGTVDDVTKRLETAAMLETEKAQRELTDAFRQAAQVAGYDADALLEVIGEVPDTVMDKVKDGDKETQTAKVKVLLDGKEEVKPFDEFITNRFPKIHESLKSNSKPAVVLPNMGVNGAAPETNPVKERAALIETGNKEKVNPFMAMAAK